MTKAKVKMGTASNDTLIGTNGVDFLYGLAGNDFLSGGNSADIIKGGAGDDKIEGGKGIDQLTGGAGNDTFVYKGFDDAKLKTSYSSGGSSDRYVPFYRLETITDFAEGDSLDFSAIPIQQRHFIGKDEFSGTIGEIRLDYESMYGGRYLMIDQDGDANADAGIKISIENSTYDGSKKTLVETTLNSGIFTWTNDPNFVVKTGDANANTITGSDSDDHLVGLAGNDYLDGKIGYDTLEGGAGNDTLISDLGGDSMSGGEGADTFVLNSIESGKYDDGAGFGAFYIGSSSIGDFDRADKIVINMPDMPIKYIGNAQFSGVAGEYNFNGSSFEFDFDGNKQEDASLNVSFSVYQDKDIKEISPNNFALDTSSQYGKDTNDTLTGTNADDKIFGLFGDDSLVGGAGNDALNGDYGNDTLVGGLGKDTLTGGDGKDTFVFSVVEKSIDTITDFQITSYYYGGDKIGLSAIDANEKSTGDQAFTFIGNAAFSKTNATGQLRFDTTSKILYGSTDADITPEFSIQLNGVKSLVTGDFIL
jgi:Ca2+-binding RTX toxin-like protein